MAFKFDGNTFVIAFFAGLIFEFCVSLLPWNQPKTQWVTTGGWRVGGTCAIEVGSEAVACICDAQRSDDELVRVEFFVDDPVTAAFAHDEGLKEMCDEFCLKGCFAQAQIQDLEGTLIESVD